MHCTFGLKTIISIIIEYLCKYKHFSEDAALLFLAKHTKGRLSSLININTTLKKVKNLKEKIFSDKSFKFKRYYSSQSLDIIK